MLDNGFLFSLLARLCRPETEQPLVNQLVTTLYRGLVEAVIQNEFPRKTLEIATRMAAIHPEGTFQADVVDESTKVVCVNLARAGTLPSAICFDTFNYILQPGGVRQDHIAIARKTDNENQVVGTDLGGVKIGGDVADRFVLFPDPMGATGSTLDTSMDLYQARGKAARYLALHLIVTPEYLKKVTTAHPDLHVYALRLDRGLSPAEVLKTAPGTHWDQEKGLNDQQYIVPGAGGLGEVLNNSWV